MLFVDVDWQVTACSIEGCENRAELLYDDEPCCIDCADLLLERQLALILSSDLLWTLPAIGDR